MAEKIGLVLTLLFALFLKLCFDKNTQQAVAQFIEWFSCIYLIIILIPVSQNVTVLSL